MAAIGIAALIAVILGAAPALGATLALVLAVDVSASVTADSYLLQHDGISRAFVDSRLVEAITAASGGIEVLVLEWSDPDKIAVTVDWQPINDSASAAAFAATVRASRRSSNGLTAIGPALLAAAATFERLPKPAVHRVIDLSGDGIANFGLPPAAARDRIVAAGITINGLAVLTEEPWLADYYRSNVIGGPNAFVVTARTFGDFAGAMRRKLMQEVVSASTAAAHPSSSQMQ
jgi:Ca-activated chloride channel homolog